MLWTPLPASRRYGTPAHDISALPNQHSAVIAPNLYHHNMELSLVATVLRHSVRILAGNPAVDLNKFA